MNLNDYQKLASETAIYPGREGFSGLVYCALKLNGEAGEVAEKIGKIIRDKDSEVGFVDREQLCLELGDVLWYVTNMAFELGYTLDQVAFANIDKLSSRKARSMLHGSGDNR